MIRFSVRPSVSPKSNQAAVAFAFENEKTHQFSFEIRDLIASAYFLVAKNGFTGAASSISFAHLANREKTPCIFVGLGSKKEFSNDVLRKSAAALVRRSKDLKIQSVLIELPQTPNLASSYQAFVEGILLGNYSFTAFKTDASTDEFNFEVVFIAPTRNSKDALAGIKRGQVFSESTNFVRDWVNTPPSDMTPADLVKKAQSLSSKNVTVRVFNKSKILKLKMGAILGVNRGSYKPPYFLHLIYKPSGKVTKRIGLCGKGITFDSGGLSLKPAGSMETMKYDMAGAATVISLFHTLNILKPQVEVHGFTPLTENMPGGNALKPGDVLKTYSGKTIEVLNTDAEGRLVLADTLSYASDQKLDEMLDIATLTGACSVALGNSIAAIMGTQSALIDRLKVSAVTCGEKLWELPLEKDYESHIKSKVADVKNTGNPMVAGTIIGGLFLKKFVSPNIPWAHIDMASVGWSNEGTALSAPGSTGAMTRTLLNYILSYN